MKTHKSPPGVVTDSVLSEVAAAVAVADPALAAEWYDLLGRSTPTPDDEQWSGPVDRMAPAAQQTDLSGPQLMDAFTTVDDPAALQAIIAAEPSWQPFVDWFVYHADAAGVGRSARAFCEYAGANQPLAVFARYGVAVAAASAAQEPATTATVDIATQVAALTADILADFRRDHPQFAGVDDAEVLTLLNEVVVQDDPAGLAPTT